MNKKGEGMVAYFVGLAIFFFAWIYVLAEIISDWGYRAVTENSLTGIEAFLYSNLNLILLLFVVGTTILMLRYQN